MDQGRNHREMMKYHKKNENKNTIYQKVWDTAKPMLGGTFIAINVYISDEERL